MKLTFTLFGILLILSFFAFINKNENLSNSKEVLSVSTEPVYWLLLHRKSNLEYLYSGVAGDKTKSTLVKTFQVKTGIPGERPTPLPQLLGQEYWLITDKQESFDNPETSPYFLTLNIPVEESEPYGPDPYLECNGQCNWILPGYFGLHGSGGNPAKLSAEDLGSSGCIRHFDEDITYLYNILDLRSQEVRYYIEDV